MTVEAVCALDTSRREYVTHNAAWVIVAKVADNTRTTPDAWTRAVAEATPQPPCEDIVTGAPTG
ncbi:hypothetical protein [Streptomyces sp. NBC_01276]|uniref:hypothetical protein n=1 Tax=Streptomyces sp. NBC_01276 TaxID=2903808 RepID=UPI00352E4DA0